MSITHERPLSGTIVCSESFIHNALMHIVHVTFLQMGTVFQPLLAVITFNVNISDTCPQLIWDDCC